MPTYQYETVPLVADEIVERFEMRQSFSDAPLASHPTTGAPVRRVISGGMALMTKAAGEGSLPAPGPGCGPASCRCGRFD